jgi:hypothetical protein
MPPKKKTMMMEKSCKAVLKVKPMDITEEDWLAKHSDGQPQNCIARLARRGQKAGGSAGLPKPRKHAI